MAGQRVRLAALSLGVVSLFAISGGVADAASDRTYRVAYRGPFGDAATCNGASAALNEPPDVYTSSCFYSQNGVSGYSIHPGWYFRYQYSID